ncbi:hypothetical protein [Pseudomonas putida]|uniref:hypothetical protein n=1 Tax=Pseudomonas putida TaxID=303 RepID=UPI00095321AE|nr:hypothetical protein [Pseudomonas putida]
MKTEAKSATAWESRSTHIPLILAALLSLFSWLLSEWWEKGLATPLNVTVSPNGCYRVESFKPFWLLPDMFHREHDPNDDREPTWFPHWEYPGFYRLYNHRSGALLGESRVYDLAYASGPLTWGAGSKSVFAGMIYLGPNTLDCIGDNPSG